MRKQRKMRGVNFGGWLIVEKWLTPSLFEGESAVDEYSLSQTKQGKRMIIKHRNRFIIESDFKWCRDHGIQLIRLPVGYWLFDDIDGYVAQQKWVDWAFRMAEKYGLLLLLDLHGVRGSQNGNEHSGRVGAVGWSSYSDQTIQLLERIAEQYGQHSALWGIELLNEPDSKIGRSELVVFYQAAYQVIRPKLQHGTHVVFHDSFRPFVFNGAVKSVPSHPVVMDVHWYLFSSKYAQHIPVVMLLLIVRMAYQLRLFWLQRRQPVIVGEWSSVLPQILFDNTPRQRHGELLQRSIAMQEKAFARAAASIYWNYKAEGRGMWNYRALTEDGVIKSEITE